MGFSEFLTYLGNPYPVTEAKVLRGMPLQKGYQSHYVVTNRAGTSSLFLSPAVLILNLGGIPDNLDGPGPYFNELVIDQTTQILPAYMITFDRNEEFLSLLQAHVRKVIEPSGDQTPTVFNDEPIVSGSVEDKPSLSSPPYQLPPPPEKNPPSLPPPSHSPPPPPNTQAVVLPAQPSNPPPPYHHPSPSPPQYQEPSTGSLGDSPTPSQRRELPIPPQESVPVKQNLGDSPVPSQRRELPIPPQESAPVKQNPFRAASGTASPIQQLVPPPTLGPSLSFICLVEHGGRNHKVEIISITSIQDLISQIARSLALSVPISCLDFFDNDFQTYVKLEKLTDLSDKPRLRTII